MDEAELTELWRKFKSSGDQESRNLIIEYYLPLVRRAAERMYYSLAQHVEVDDLYSAGLLGLIDAVSKYVPSRQIKFETYSSLRIKGAMLDDLRSRDWVPRSVRVSHQRYREAFHELFQEYQRLPSDAEMMQRLGIGEDEFHQLCRDANLNTIVPLQDLSGADPSGEEGNAESWLPDTRNVRDDRNRDRRQFLRQLVEALPERQKQVLVMYHVEELTLKEISAVLGVSEGRISQILSAAICKLREQFHEEARSLLG